MKENKEIQEKPLPSASETVMNMHKLKSIFADQSNVEEFCTKKYSIYFCTNS